MALRAAHGESADAPRPRTRREWALQQLGLTEADLGPASGDANAQGVDPAAMRTLKSAFHRLVLMCASWDAPTTPKAHRGCCLTSRLLHAL